MKKIGPCKIVRKISTNAYEIELPEGIGISPIFNVAYFYPYKEAKKELQEKTTGDKVQTMNQEEQIPKTAKNEVEVVLEEYPKEPKDRLISSIQSNGKDSQWRMLAS